MILADGCFDPLHVGHLLYLRAARAFGHVVVRVATDEDIRAKGREPFQSQWERREMLAYLGYVTTGHPTLADAIRKERPDMLVKGNDWNGHLPEDVLAACAESGTEILFTQTIGKTSTARLAG